MMDEGEDSSGQRSLNEGVGINAVDKMKIEALGDSGWIIRDLDFPAHAVAEQLRFLGIPGLLDAAASYDTVGVFGEPGAVTERLLATALSSMSSLPPQPLVVHEIPVCYEMGEDLAEVCDQLHLEAEEFKSLHQSQEYECFAVGFCPGFGYLGWLPERLAGIPRKPTPRIRVEAGSVALTGRQTAVYPLIRPGGWNIIGRTPLTLVDVQDNYFPITAGDFVRFVAIRLDEFDPLLGKRL